MAEKSVAGETSKGKSDETCSLVEMGDCEIWLQEIEAL
jgi:hypothetical protein